MFGCRVVDLGAGEGRFMASALDSGALSAVGYELPENSAHKFVFDAALRRIYYWLDFKKVPAHWLAQDIDQVFFSLSHIEFHIFSIQLVVFILELIISPLSAH